MSYFKPNYEWLSPKTPTGQKRKNKKDGKPTGQTHFSVNDRRLEAIQAEGAIAYHRGESRDSNPKISHQSREAWFQGWDGAHVEPKDGEL